MPNDIRNLLDNIINDTNNSYPTQNHQPIEHPVVQFDKGKFREKLSMYVLKDIISAMMHDETKDLDGMIDESITQHIQDNYNGTCFGYLSQARANCNNSPLLGDIIQEIDDTVEDTAKEVSDKKDESVADKVDVKKILNESENYDEFREKLKKQVSEQVVNDVAKVVTTKDDAATFDSLDEKFAKSNMDDESDPTTESVILRMTSSIVVESGMNGKPIPTEEGINRAVVKFCLAKMDHLFKQRPKKYDIYTKYL